MVIKKLFLDEDWCLLRQKSKSPNHILRPLGIDLIMKRCLLHNDVNLPKYVLIIFLI